MEMFEKASRTKIRFDYKGICTVEDLWGLPLTALDAIFKSLNKANKEKAEESLLDNKSTEDEVLELKLSIIKHIVTVRLEEKRLREEAAAMSEKKQKALGILAARQDNKMAEMSDEELMKIAGK